MLPNNLLFNVFSDNYICNNEINMLYLPTKTCETNICMGPLHFSVIVRSLGCVRYP